MAERQGIVERTEPSLGAGQLTIIRAAAGLLNSTTAWPTVLSLTGAPLGSSNSPRAGKFWTIRSSSETARMELDSSDEDFGRWFHRNHDEIRTQPCRRRSIDANREAAQLSCPNGRESEGEFQRASCQARELRQGSGIHGSSSNCLDALRRTGLDQRAETNRPLSRDPRPDTPDQPHCAGDALGL
jgi:hypothetical protein